LGGDLEGEEEFALAAGVGDLEEIECALVVAVAGPAVGVPWACWPMGLDVAGDLESKEEFVLA
jgi:hypothetical protein